MCREHVRVCMSCIVDDAAAFAAAAHLVSSVVVVAVAGEVVTTKYATQTMALQQHRLQHKK